MPLLLEPVVGERVEDLGADNLIGDGARRGINVDGAHDLDRERDDVRRRQAREFQRFDAASLRLGKGL